jgi:hypothetical protein
MIGMKRNKNNRDAKTLAAETKRSLWGLSVGLMLGAIFLIWVFSGQSQGPGGQTTVAQAMRGEPITASSNENSLIAVPLPKAQADSINAASSNATDSVKQTAGGRKNVVPENAGFDRLSGFSLKLTDDLILGSGDPLSNSHDIAAQIPDSIKTLNEKEVSIDGFMLPLRLRDGKACDFLLLKNQSMCCYGATPAMNEYVIVRMAGSGVKPVMDRVITVSGTLHVGEIRENNSLAGIYQLDGDKMEGPAQP